MFKKIRVSSCQHVNFYNLQMVITWVLRFKNIHEHERISAYFVELKILNEEKVTGFENSRLLKQLSDEFNGHVFFEKKVERLSLVNRAHFDEGEEDLD